MLRPPSIFRTMAEVAEADRLHYELEPTDVTMSAEDYKKKEWKVVRTIKHDSNGMEFEVVFGFSFYENMHLLRVRLK